MTRKQWIKEAMEYIDKYADKKVLDGADGTSMFGYVVSMRILEDALNGRKD